MITSELNEQFWMFHKKNPHVFAEFERYAVMMKGRGFRQYSARTILHLIRWHSDMTTSDPDNQGFKINNNHSPRYALLLEAKRPEFRGFFNNRGIKMDIPASELGQGQPSLFAS
jgi:hypothetical protein